MAVRSRRSRRSGPRDQRDIVAAIHGPSLPTAALKRSIALLEQRIVRRFERHKADFARAATHQTRVLAPLMTAIKNDRRAAEAARAYEKPPVPPKRRTKPRFPAMSTPISPQVRGGSVLTIAAPPYAVDWSAGSGSTSNSTTSGGGFGEKNEGIFGASTIVFSGGSAWGGGGVAAQIQPIADNEVMRFSAFVRYSYAWHDSSSWGDTAHQDALLGVFVTSFQLDGTGGRVELDHRTQMWSDGTGWWEDHSDSGDDLVWPASQIEVFLPVTSSRIFLFWIWAQNTGDAGGNSTSQGNLDGIVPFMVFEQFT